MQKDYLALQQGLTYAVNNGDEKAVQKLLQDGANPNDTIRKNMNYLQSSVYSSSESTSVRFNSRELDYEENMLPLLSREDTKLLEFI
ncbi:MAG: hypothetical protein JSR33_06040 [Proteobacteria bacterium]|nr:hypothetical protein [Pseudomonadota bacterium]